MEIQGPVYVISMELHRTLIKAEDMEDLLIATARAMAATRLDPRKNNEAVLQYGPFKFDFRAVNRSDVQPHWTGTLHYDGQVLPLYRWNDDGTLPDLHNLLQPAGGSTAQDQATCACCGGSAWLDRITICENCYEDKLA